MLLSLKAVKPGSVLTPQTSRSPLHSALRGFIQPVRFEGHLKTAVPNRTRGPKRIQIKILKVFIWAIAMLICLNNTSLSLCLLFFLCRMGILKTISNTETQVCLLGFCLAIKRRATNQLIRGIWEIAHVKGLLIGLGILSCQNRFCLYLYLLSKTTLHLPSSGLLLVWGFM